MYHSLSHVNTGRAAVFYKILYTKSTPLDLMLKGDPAAVPQEAVEIPTGLGTDLFSHNEHVYSTKPPSLIEN